MTDDSIQAGALYTYEVDKLGRTTKTFAKYIPGGDRRLDYQYDARGDLTTFTLNEPNEVLAHVYTYAADSGRIATALFPGESTALTIARWPHDGVKSIDYPGGVRREVDHDVRGPVSEIRIKPPAGAATLAGVRTRQCAPPPRAAITPQAILRDCPSRSVAAIDLVGSLSPRCARAI